MAKSDEEALAQAILLKLIETNEQHPHNWERPREPPVVLAKRAWAQAGAFYAEMPDGSADWEAGDARDEELGQAVEVWAWRKEVIQAWDDFAERNRDRGHTSQCALATDDRATACTCGLDHFRHVLLSALKRTTT